MPAIIPIFPFVLFLVSCRMQRSQNGDEIVPPQCRKILSYNSYLTEWEMVRVLMSDSSSSEMSELSVVEMARLLR